MNISMYGPNSKCYCTYIDLRTCLRFATPSPLSHFYHCSWCVASGRLAATPNCFTIRIQLTSNMNR